MNTSLTKNQLTLLDFLKKYIAIKGEAPSLGELQKELMIKTKRGVVQYLEALEKKGYIQRSSKARGIHIIDKFKSKSESFATIPILGYANAGEPLSFAFQDAIGSLQIDHKLLPQNEKVFALIVKGDSMNKKRVGHIKIVNGNYVIVSRNQPLFDGDVALAIIDDCATIKTFTRRSNMIILYPESDNPVHKPIYVHEESSAFINGKVIAVLDNQPLKKPIVTKILH